MTFFQYKYEYFKTLDEAMIEGRRGNLVGIIHFTESFTEAILTRMADGNEAPYDVLLNSELSVYLDQTGKQINY